MRCGGERHCHQLRGKKRVTIDKWSYLAVIIILLFLFLRLIFLHCFIVVIVVVVVVVIVIVIIIIIVLLVDDTASCALSLSLVFTGRLGFRRALRTTLRTRSATVIKDGFSVVGWVIHGRATSRRNETMTYAEDAGFRTGEDISIMEFSVAGLSSCDGV
ncbi:hypothetical protein BJV78DRAFT_654646 [Lactifluus subvellereus]|nr:hypothetical protein BJV78DRAFT_654646 [Lactifluus subvellereus]